jgi:hypothetical protein
MVSHVLVADVFLYATEMRDTPVLGTSPPVRVSRVLGLARRASSIRQKTCYKDCLLAIFNGYCYFNYMLHLDFENTCPQMFIVQISDVVNV